MELQRYIMFYWEIDDESGVPFVQTEQSNGSQIELGYFVMKTNAVLKGQPYASLKRYAQK
jgi:hypothetical protein